MDRLYLAICNEILSRMSEIAEYLSHIRKSLEIVYVQIFICIMCILRSTMPQEIL
jgi:hypothetical protein